MSWTPVIGFSPPERNTAGVGPHASSSTSGALLQPAARADVCSARGTSSTRCARCSQASTRTRSRDEHVDMTHAVVLPPAPYVLHDRRDTGRALRVTWHGAEDLFVLSIWRDELCASTFQLKRSDVPALIGALAGGLAEAPASWSVVRYQSTSRGSAVLKRIAEPFRTYLRGARVPVGT